MTKRWSNLIRHGLLGGSLLGALATNARADACHLNDRSDTVVAVTIGIDAGARLSLIGGVEARRCVLDRGDVMARVEVGGGPVRLIAGARARPFDGDGSQVGLEAGLAIDVKGGIGGHLAGSLGPNYAYVALQALFPLTSPPSRPSRAHVGVIVGVAPWALSEPRITQGRPIVVDGRIVRPDVIAHSETPPGAEDRAVKRHFTRSAKHEYSSVWTFLRLAGELHAVGAPAQLFAAALDAADDEVRHAELCGQAAGGLRLAPLAMRHAQPRFTQRTPGALAILAAEAWREGCLNEGAAAEQARLAADDAQGPTRAMLATIARDEATHAALGWAVLSWVHGLAPALVRDATFDDSPGLAAIVDAPMDTALARRGVASAAVTIAATADATAHALARRADLLA